MKKILKVLLICLIAFTTRVFAIEPTQEFYINDYANILSEETEEYIQTNSVSLANATTAQIVVVTVPSLNGVSLEEYSTNLFRQFGIGDKEKNNGLLILIALEERKSRIEVGYGLEGVLPDGKTGRIQDEYMIPYFKDNNFDEGILNGYKALFKEVANEYNYDASNVNPIPVENEEDDTFLNFIALLLIGKIFYTFIILGTDLITAREKMTQFIILEIWSIGVAMGSYHYAGDAAFMLIVVGTLFNILAVLVHFVDFGSGGYSSGGYHGGGGFSSGGGFYGGGGLSGGGGSSRSF